MQIIFNKGHTRLHGRTTHGNGNDVQKAKTLQNLQPSHTVKFQLSLKKNNNTGTTIRPRGSTVDTVVFAPLDSRKLSCCKRGPMDHS